MRRGGLLFNSPVAGVHGSVEAISARHEPAERTRGRATCMRAFLPKQFGRSSVVKEPQEPAPRTATQLLHGA